MVICRASMAAAEQRTDIEQGLDGAGLEQRRIETALLVGHLHIVESEFRRGEDDHMHLAAYLHLAAEQLGRLLLEDRAVVVPVDDERRGEQRAEHENQEGRQTEQERVHLRLKALILRARAFRGAEIRRRTREHLEGLAHDNAKILPGLRIFNGSSAFFMAAITARRPRRAHGGEIAHLALAHAMLAGAGAAQGRARAPRGGLGSLARGGAPPGPPCR